MVWILRPHGADWAGRLHLLCFVLHSLRLVSVIFLNNFLLAAMHRDKVVGLALMAIGVAGILIYGWLVFLSPWQFLILQLTAFIAVVAVLGILAWVGYALATTPPPKPIEEIERKIQKALEEIERQMKEESSQQASQ